MMASTQQLETLQSIELEKSKWEKSFGGKASNCFIEEVKSSELFRFDWGELLSAAPTALSLMGSCWIAASHKDADSIRLGESRPNGKWQYLPNRDRPTLRAALVDVCNIGGDKAFSCAGENMEILAATSKRIFNSEDGAIKEVFDRLSALNETDESFEDFKDALDLLNKEASRCSTVATEMRQAFGLWRNMVKELHASSEQQRGNTHGEARTVEGQVQASEIEESVTKQNIESAKEAVAALDKRVQRAEQRLDRATENVPGPWATVAMSTVNGYAQAVPSIVAGVLPTVLAAAVNPVAGASMALSSGLRLGQQPQPQNGLQNGAVNGLLTGLASQGGLASPAPGRHDSALDVAAQLCPLLTTFYEFVGGAAGKLDWAKFENSEPGQKQVCAWLIGNLNAFKSSPELTQTETSTNMIAAIDLALKVAKSIQDAVEFRKDLSAAPIPEHVFAAWKADVKSARDTILALNASANVTAGTAMPNRFAEVKIDIPKPDLSAQNAAISNAMQAVQTSQAALDLAQDKYDEALQKQAKTKTAMVEIEKKLATLRENGKLLENIKDVLRDCIAVLVDLTVQIGRIETFFTRLQLLISEYIQPKVDRFQVSMQKTGDRSFKNGYLTTDDITMQTLYMVTLQMKAYFSLLYDIADMYNGVHRGYIVRGLELMGDLAKISSDNSDAQAKLVKYTAESSKAIADLVGKKQKEMLAGLKSRAQNAQAMTKKLEGRAMAVGIDAKATRKAITQGAEIVKDEAKQELAAAAPSVLRRRGNANDD